MHELDILSVLDIIIHVTCILASLACTSVGLKHLEIHKDDHDKD
jgi:hypothetical protein